MVVVEGVARSLDPQLNMWESARPVVTDYIQDNLGPRAMAQDAKRIAQTISRYAPLLPRVVDEMLWDRAHRAEQQATQAPVRDRSGWWIGAAMMAVGLSLGLLIG